MAPRGHGLALVQMTLRRWELDWVPRGESVVALARTVLGRGVVVGSPPGSAEPSGSGAQEGVSYPLH